MTTRFIFASEIQAVLTKGDREVTLPKGSRISPQAADMIREYNLKVTWVEPGEQAAPAGDKPVGPHSVLPKAAAPTAGDGEVDEAQIEELAQRVLARLAEAKGEAPIPASSAESKAAPAAAPAPDDDLVICRCEEITKGQIKQAIRDGMCTLNGVKRVTRAGMGLCQGQTCARLVSGILARELGIPASEIEPTTARAPSRPVSMAVLARG